VIVYLGLLNRYQGLDLLLQAAVKLKNKNLDFQMLVMGYPLSYYPERARSLGLDKQLKFTGRMDYNQAQKWLALGDIAVAPKIARSESNGKVLNYLAMGIPMVCFDKPVNRELAGDCAEYAAYDPDSEDKSSEALAQGMAKLLNDPGRRKELSAKSRERALQQFSWQAVAGRILKAYQELAS
jgi:glycosyltransferase involved in cell wall biosynthesis